MPRLTRIVAIVAVGAMGLPSLPDEALAKGGHGGHGGTHASGHRGGTRPAHRHHARVSGFVAGTAFAAGVYSGFPGPYSYYYGPAWTGIDPAPPVMYVERFPGEPTAETRDAVYCPERAAPYPYVKTCPGGWQRLFSLEQAAQQVPSR